MSVGSWRLGFGGFAVALTAVWLVGCNHPAPATDAGHPVVDAGVDAGSADAGSDAGQASDSGVDAGPPPLTLTQVLPPRGESGGSTQVTLKGSAFILGFSDTATDAQRQTTLSFGANPVISFQIIDDTTIDLTTPPGVAGPADVTLKNPNGSVTCTGCFTYFDPLFATSVSPNSGPLRGGNTIGISGSGFTTGVQVLIGGQSSPSITVASTTMLNVVVPRGAGAGLVDVVVYSKAGIATLRRDYQYYPDLRVTGIAPLTGPITGGTVVTLNGQGFDGATSVTFGGLAGTALGVTSGALLNVTTPAAATAGAVDITIVTPRDQWTVKNGFSYVNGLATLAPYAVYPHLGLPTGGNQVTLTGDGFSAGPLTVTFGGQAAVVGMTTANTAVVTVPARGASNRVVDVVVTAGASNATLTGAYTYQLGVGSISPTQGPAAGGTPANVAGFDLPPDADVFIGALQATDGAPITEAQVPITTPAGSGGAPNDVWVRAHSDPENEAVLPAAFTFDENLSIGRVQPDQGAIAGGTLVSVVGAGFGNGTVVTFGVNVAKDIKVIDSHTLSCRTPRGDVGTVDVSATRLTQSDVEPAGFSYFDPRSFSGGLSGGPLTGTINVSVIDDTQGAVGNPVPFANVMLGIDPATPFIGQTDDRGQITFSDPSLVKPQTVTAWKDGYDSATVTAVTTENVTVLLTQTGGGQGSPTPPPPPPPPAIITGRVTGFKAPRVLQPNEQLVARVFVAQTSFYDGPPYSPPQPHGQEQWVVLQDGGNYLVFSGPGIRATYAVMGILETGTSNFTPFLMGVHRGISADPDNPATGADIVLDMHLDMTVPVTVQGPIDVAGSAAANDIYAWLDLGNEGFIPNPNNWSTGLAASTSITSVMPQNTFPNFPELDGTNFVFLNSSHGANPYPQSLYFTRQPGDLTQGVSIGPMLPTPVITDPTLATTMNGWDGNLSWTVDPGPTPDIYEVLVLMPTLFGQVTLWTIILPGTQTQAQMPQAALASLQSTYAGQTMFVAVEASRSSKFDYNQWTYDSLNVINWTSYTLALSDPFTP